MHPSPANPSIQLPAMLDHAAVRPAWTKRLAATACYLGLTPIFRLIRIRDDPFIKHHSAQGIATILAFLAVVVIGLITWLSLSFLLVDRRELYESIPLLGLSPVMRDVLIQSPPLLAWLILWLGGILLALFGSRRTLPLIGWLARRSGLMRVAFVGNVILLLAVMLTTVLAVHASSLTRDDDQPATVYMLYDDMEIIPQWIFDLGFYRMSLTAREKWGPGNVVVAPLDEHHLRLALRHGRLLILACHGVDGEIYSTRFQIAPPAIATPSEPEAHGLCFGNIDDGRSGPWKFLEVGPNLRYVYNSGCDCGVKSAEWEMALAPAKVQTFGRLSAVAEHIRWLWTDGPRRIKEMN